MSDLPRHQETGDISRLNDGPKRTRPARLYALWIAGISLVVVIIVLHLTGVIGAEGH
jgi:uncharacterized membrane protein